MPSKTAREAKRILVTGAAGFIGSHLAERLAAIGHTVVGLDSFTTGYDPLIKERNASELAASGVVVLRLDLVEDDLAPALEGIDVVYHLAAQPGLSAAAGWDAYVRNNITATHRLLDAVEQGGSVRGVVHISTSSVYGSDASGSEDAEPRPISHYGVSKLTAEQLVLARARAGGVAGCSLRLFSVYGPRERPEKLYPRLIDSILRNQPFPLYEGSDQHRRSFTYVADVVDGMVAVLPDLERWRGEIFNLGTDSSITTGDGIRIVEALLGRRARIKTCSPRPGDQARTHAQIGKARRLLGYQPRIEPREGLARQVEWYREGVERGWPMSQVR